MKSLRTTLLHVVSLIIGFFARESLAYETIKNWSRLPDNASKLYEHAFSLMGEFPVYEDANAKTVIRNGWIYTNESLEALVRQDHGILEMINGVRTIDDCDFIRGRAIGADLKIPHLGNATRLSKFLLLKGRYLEHRKDYENALKCFIVNKHLAHHIALDGLSLSKKVSGDIEENGNLAMSNVLTYPAAYRQQALLDCLYAESKRVPMHHMLRRELDYINTEATKMFSQEFINERFEKILSQEDFKIFDEFGMLDNERIAEWFKHLSWIIYNHLIEPTRLGYFVWANLRYGEIVDQYGLGRENVLSKSKDEVIKKVIRAYGLNVEKVPVDPAVMEKYLSRLEMAFKVVIAMGIPDFEQMLQGECRNIFAARALIYQLGLEVFKSKTGEYPEVLAELVPSILPSLPIDPYDGRAVRFMKKGRRYQFYSVGPDGKDSEGTAIAKTDEGRISGDIVYDSP